MRPEIGRERRLQREGLTLAIGLEPDGSINGERSVHRHDCPTLAARMDIATTRVLPSDTGGATVCVVLGNVGATTDRPPPRPPIDNDGLALDEGNDFA